MKRALLINILWVCYLFSANTECKWLLTVSDSASRLKIWDCAQLFTCAATRSFNLLNSPTGSLFPFLCLFSLCLWEWAVLRGAAASSRLHFTHTKVAVYCSTHTDNDLHFLCRLPWRPCACHCVSRSNGTFSKKVFFIFFTEYRALLGNYLFYYNISLLC